MPAKPSQIDQDAANALSGWQITPKQPASSKGQGLLFEQGDGLSRAVRKSLDQGQRLLFGDADNTPPTKD
jgi:hypothetical protein